MMDKIKMRSQLLDELLSDIDDSESEKLKPAGAVVMEESEATPMKCDADADVDQAIAESEMGDEDEMDPEDLKMLLKQYLGA